MEWEWLKEEIAPSGAFFPGKIKDTDTSVVMINVSYYAQRLPLSQKPMTLGEVLDLFVNMCYRVLKTARVVVLVADGKPHFLKKKPPKTCSSKQGGPYMPSTETELMPRTWNDHAATNYRVLRRELFAALFNRCMTSFVPPDPGRFLILSGFPGQMEWVRTRYDDPLHMDSHLGDDAIQSFKDVKLWDRLPLTKAHELQDPKLYHRTFWIERAPTGAVVRRKWKGVSSSIECAHMRMLYLMHHFARDKVVLMTNPSCSDLIGAALLHCYERIVARQRDGTFELQGSLKITWPHPSPQQQQHLDIDALYKSICSYEPFVENEVMNPELLCVWLMIVRQYSGGNNSFSESTATTKENNNLWHSLISQLPKFANLCMLSKHTRPDTRATDRNLFIQEDLVGVLLPSLTLAQIRQTIYILHYLKKTPLGDTENPFEPFYPYALNDLQKPILLDSLQSEAFREMDLCYKKHLFKTYQEQLQKRQKAM